MSNVPKLRFPGFEGEWEEKKARNIFFSISDKNHSGELPVISVTQNRGTVARQDLNIDIKYDKTNLINYKRIRLNNFVISLRSFQGGIDRSNHDGLVSPAYTIFDFVKPDGYNPYFFEHIFKSKNFINRLVTLIYGIRDGKAIGFNDFSSLNISVPLKGEQTKIADFFTLIDKKITKQDEKVGALEHYKKGLMHKIFSREIRFKDEYGKDHPVWVRKKAKELFYNISDKNHNGDLVVLSVTQDRGTIIREELSIDIKYDRANLKNYKRVKRDNFIISLRSFQGGIDRSNHDGLVSPAYTIFDLSEPEKHDPRYFGSIFKSRNFINRLNTLIYGIRDGKAIGFTDFAELPLYIPKQPEQNKIANFLTLFDSKIEKEKEKLGALREQKKGLLQQMFI